MKKLKYKNFVGSVEFSEADGGFFGKILGIEDIVSYDGKTLEELEIEFREVVDDYLAIKEYEKEKAAGTLKTYTSEEFWKELGLE